MRLSYHPQLVNGSAGDPALYVEFLFERRAILFDLGNLSHWPSRKILRVSDVFVSHTHVDHFIGFDHLLRVSLGRRKHINLYGPPGFIEQINHKLAAYTWNLVQNYAVDLNLLVSEIGPHFSMKRSLFRCRNGFRPETLAPAILDTDVILDETSLRVRAVTLDHKIPSLAYALEEKYHLNVWKNKLVKLGIPPGPWLQQLKQMVAMETPDETMFIVRWREHNLDRSQVFELGTLKSEILSVVPGQKICYVVDCAFTPENKVKITDLARSASLLYIEASFSDEDAERAASRSHLTARQAGLLGRLAGAQRLIPIHFSTKYSGAEARLEQEAQAAFRQLVE